MRKLNLGPLNGHRPYSHNFHLHLSIWIRRVSPIPTHRRRPRASSSFHPLRLEASNLISFGITISSPSDAYFSKAFLRDTVTLSHLDLGFVDSTHLPEVLGALDCRLKTFKLSRYQRRAESSATALSSLLEALNAEAFVWLIGITFSQRTFGDVPSADGWSQVMSELGTRGIQMKTETEKW